MNRLIKETRLTAVGFNLTDKKLYRLRDKAWKDTSALEAQFYQGRFNPPYRNIHEIRDTFQRATNFERAAAELIRKKYHDLDYLADGREKEAIIYESVVHSLDTDGVFAFEYYRDHIDESINEGINNLNRAASFDRTPSKILRKYYKSYTKESLTKNAQNCLRGAIRNAYHARLIQRHFKIRLNVSESEAIEPRSVLARLKQGNFSQEIIDEVEKQVLDILN